MFSYFTGDKTEAQRGEGIGPREHGCEAGSLEFEHRRFDLVGTGRACGHIPWPESCVGRNCGSFFCNGIFGHALRYMPRRKLVAQADHRPLKGLESPNRPETAWRTEGLTDVLSVGVGLSSLCKVKTSLQPRMFLDSNPDCPEYQGPYL